MGTFINATRPPHPFYPVEANIVGYLANEATVPQLLGTFGAGCIVVLGCTLALVKGHNPNLPAKDKAAVLWNVLSRLANSSLGNISILTASLLAGGTIHLFFEGLALPI